MPDAAILDASGKFLDVGVIGAACIFLMVALAWVVRQWQAEQKAHQVTRDQRVEDLKEQMADRIAMRDAMSSTAAALNQNTATMNAIIDLVRERR